MTPENAAIIPELFKAIKADWALCDDRDEDSFMVLVDEQRDIHPTLKPEKTLVNNLEKDGYIKLDAARSSKKGEAREMMEWFDGPVPVPFVYIYQVTPKGHALATELETT